MRSNFLTVRLRRFATICLVLVGVSGVAKAHVAFEAPLAGDTLVVGEAVTVAWTDVILHDPEGFGLDLLMSEDGEGISIAQGLSIDTHSYEWVPGEPCDPCFLRVTQFNTINYDYYETIPITITGSGSSGGSGPGGSSGEANGGASGSSDGGTGGPSNGGVGGSSSSDGGTNSGGGSGATGGTAGSASSTGGAAGSSVASGGTSAAGGPSAGAPNAGAGASRDDDAGGADEGCSMSGSASPRSASALVPLLLAALGAALRRRRPCLRATSDSRGSMIQE